MDGMGPRGVPRPDMYHRGKSHEELKAMTDAGEPAVSQEIADQWRSMGDGLEEAGRLLRDAVSGSESGWTGVAADAMRYRLGQVADWSMSTGQGFTAASSAIGTQSGAVGEAKTRMPEPVPYDPGQIISEAGAGGLLGIMALPQKLYAQQQKHNAAYQEAVLVVTGRDTHLAKGATVIPEFTMPPALNDDVGSPPPVPDDERGGEPPGRDDGPVGGPGDPSDGPPSSGWPGATEPGSGQTGSGQPGRLPAGPAQQDPGLTTPGSDTSAPTGGRTFAPVGSTGPGTGPGPGVLPVGGFGPGGGAGGAGSGGGPRGSGPGAGGGPRGIGGVTGIGPGGATESATGGRGAAAGARGGAGMGGVPMGAGRGQGDEDTEHQRPTWLEEPDPESVFGTDEVTSPPVLGLD